MENISFRIENDFAPVAKLMSSHHVLVVHPSLPVHSLQELIAVMKAQPDGLSYSSGGNGTPAHLAGELFKQKVGARATHVPYRALPQAITDLVSGVVQFQFVSPLPVLDLIAAGKLRAIAVTAPERIPGLQNVPTVVEQGFPGLVIQDWIGLFVRRDVPEETMTRLNRAVNAALAEPAVREALAKIAAVPGSTSPDEFATFIKAEVGYWDRVVKQAGIKVH